MFSRQKLVLLIPLVFLAGARLMICLNVQERQVVHGIVKGASGDAVAEAVVRLRGSDSYTRTDERGRFQLPVDDHAGQVTAWAPGYFVGGVHLVNFADLDDVLIVLHPHPGVDNPDYKFISPLDEDNPTACSRCHSERTGETNGDMPINEWLQDAHSGAATNPRFLSLYNGTSIDGIAGLATTYQYDPVQGINVPVAPSMGAGQVGVGYRLDFPDQSGSCATCHVPVLALEEPYNADPNNAQAVALDGISCDFCHKIQDVRLLPDGLPAAGLPGVLSIDFLRPPDEKQVFIGPLDDTPGDDIYSPLQDESLVCAACHTGRFWDTPIYNSFGEWLASPYSVPETGQTCQDCHMPHAGVTTFAQLPPDEMEEIPPRNPATIFSHRMPGAADQHFLENTASVDVETQRADGKLYVTVHVTNTGAGHHIPTDNPLRNIILLVQVQDAGGHPLTQVSGSTIPTWGGEGNPGDGYYAGQPGVIYAKILADYYTGEIPTYAYWRQTRLVSDNRIPALATDESTYTFDLASDDSNITVDVRLYLRRAFIELMDLKGWDTPDILMEHEVVRLP